MNPTEFVRPHYTHQFLIVFDEDLAFDEVVHNIIKLPNFVEVLNDFYFNMDDVEEICKDYVVNPKDTILGRFITPYFIRIAESEYKEIDYKRIFSFTDDDDSEYLNLIVSVALDDKEDMDMEDFCNSATSYVVSRFASKYLNSPYLYTTFLVNDINESNIDLYRQFVSMGMVALTDGGHI